MSAPLAECKPGERSRSSVAERSAPGSWRQRREGRPPGDQAPWKDADVPALPGLPGVGARAGPQRLGKQRVETLQILRALELPDYGWQNHPAVRMWRGRTPALVRYGLDCVRVWTGRGHGDSTADQIAEFAPWVAGLSQADLARQSLLPSWLGDERLHRSHRSQLIAKEPDFYRPLFPESPEGLDYFWPEPDPVADAPQAGPLGFVWVLRPETEQALGRAVLTGVVGFGAATGVPVDASVGELAALRALQSNPGRRPSRALRALADFVQAVRTG